jgi:hypothetical protein
MNMYLVRRLPLVLLVLAMMSACGGEGQVEELQIQADTADEQALKVQADTAEMQAVIDGSGPQQRFFEFQAARCQKGA